MKSSQPFFTVDIISDEDDHPSLILPTPIPLNKMKSPENMSNGEGFAPPFLIIVDDPTPQKLNSSWTPSIIPETPLSFGSDSSIVKCSLARSSSREKFDGISSLICLESDNEFEDGFKRENFKENCRLDLVSENEMDGLLCSMKDIAYQNSSKVATSTTTFDYYDEYTGISDLNKISEESQSNNDYLAVNLATKARHEKDDDCFNHSRQSPSPIKSKVKRRKFNANNDNQVQERKQSKEEKTRIIEDRKQKKQDEKLQKEALKAEATELKKMEKEKQKWEKGKLASKSIIAEIDAKILENGSIGGHLLTRFAEKGLSYRITSNPIEKSILWKICVPEQTAQLSDTMSEVLYILLLYQAEEFCDLVTNESLIEHLYKVRRRYPLFTICFLTNKVMSFINKCEQSRYKSSSNLNGWKRPPVEEALAKLCTHFTKVHSRQCIDEAEIADHIVGLTSSLATCHFRKKLTWLSVNANGSFISKDFIDKKLIRKNVWLKALAAIPKVQPRHAIAIWKKYPTMRSLLNAYLDSNKSVHEKEFLLKDLMVEGLLGKEDRRLGELCSKRIFRVLMANSGGIRTDDVEDGADLFQP